MGVPAFSIWGILLTDTEIRKAKTKEVAYSMTDGRGLHLGARPIAEMEAPELAAMVKAVEARGVGDFARRALETSRQIFR
jgi:hypothetical protein